MSNDTQADAPQGEPPAGPPVRTVNTADLLHGEKELRIVHEGQYYRLLVTRNGKLILQK